MLSDRCNCVLAFLDLFLFLRCLGVNALSLVDNKGGGLTEAAEGAGDFGFGFILGFEVFGVVSLSDLVLERESLAWTLGEGSAVSGRSISGGPAPRSS